MTPEDPNPGPPPDGSQGGTGQRAGATASGTSEYLIQFFKYDHLPATLQAISKPFGDLAAKMVIDLPRNPERTTALRKLLEAKDCAVRALLFR